MHEQRGGTGGSEIIVKTNCPIANRSIDHLAPLGTRQDNSSNRLFNRKLYKLYPKGQFLSILDLGCSGGAFVRDCFDDGHCAIGLEGSDYSKLMKRAEWRNIPEYLFTCDITHRFEIEHDDGSGIRFDIITAWEVMEHIGKHRLFSVISNVKYHFAKGGLWIMSISPKPYSVRGIQYHATVEPKTWWINEFRKHGFENQPQLVRYFKPDWVRSPKHSFHLVLARDNHFPRPPSFWKRLLSNLT